MCERRLSNRDLTREARTELHGVIMLLFFSSGRVISFTCGWKSAQIDVFGWNIHGRFVQAILRRIQDSKTLLDVYC